MADSRSTIWTLKDVHRARNNATYPRGFALEYILVGGGGAGGSAGGSPVNQPYAGGGGAGGFVTNEGDFGYVVETGFTYNITVGAGGTAPAGSGATSGANTLFNSPSTVAPGVVVTAFGGGGGGGWGDVISFGVPAACNLGSNETNIRRGGDGGSGGGGGTGWHWGVVGGRAITSTSPFLNGFGCTCAGAQGYNGGYGGAYGSTNAGGGGGGAGRVGYDWYGATYGAPFTSACSFGGGTGRTGFDGVVYAGGGGGGQYAPGPNAWCGCPIGFGGSGVGGRGGYNTPSAACCAGCPGTTNKGGGGGGSSGNQPPGNPMPLTAGGSGGSGVVVIRYSDTNPAATVTTGNPTYLVTGGYRYYTFTATGSIRW